MKRFRGTRRIRPGDGNDAGHRAALAVSLAQAEEEEQEGARAMCLHCGDGGSAEQLMLCDGLGCENVRRLRDRWNWPRGTLRESADGVSCE